MKRIVAAFAAVALAAGLGACSSAEGDRSSTVDTGTTASSVSAKPPTTEEVDQLIEDVPYVLSPFDGQTAAPEPTGLESALEACELKSGQPGIQLGDDGYTLVTTLVKPGNPEGIHSDDGTMKCLAEQIEMPLRTQMKIEQNSSAISYDTSALWDGYTVEWSVTTDPVQMQIVFLESAT